MVIEKKSKGTEKKKRIKDKNIYDLDTNDKFRDNNEN